MCIYIYIYIYTYIHTYVEALTIHTHNYTRHANHYRRASAAIPMFVAG